MTQPGIVSVDPSVTGNAAGLLFQKTGERKWDVVDEIFQRGSPERPVIEEDMCQAIRAKWPEVTDLVVDTANSTVFATRARQFGLTVHPARKSVPDGIRAVNSNLTNGTMRIHSKNCRQLLRQCDAYAFSDSRNSDKVIKANDDGPDAMRYGVMRLMPPRYAKIYT